jgi:DNA-binding CsgD family transcriptional regulator
MRQWFANAGRARSGSAVGGMVRALGNDDFQSRVLDELRDVLPAASWSVYRTGARCRPTLFMSASRGIADRTRDCWWAYLSGPYQRDNSFGMSVSAAAPRLCHVTAQEMPAEHRARVYEAHGVRERVSIVEREDEALFAVNLYRHDHQQPFTDAQICAFESVALPLLELARKHIQISTPAARAHPTETTPSLPPTAGQVRDTLATLNASLTARELDVCVRLVQGMTHDGIAADLGVGLTTVKTYRNRAFARLGIHFRNELFALVLRLSRP